MPTYPDRSFLTVAGPYLLLTGLSAPVSGADWSLTSPFANYQLRSPLSNSLLASPYHFRSREIPSPKPFVWFRAKTDKGIVCLADHLHSVIIHNSSYKNDIKYLEANTHHNNRGNNIGNNRTNNNINMNYKISKNINKNRRRNVFWFNPSLCKLSNINTGK